MFERMTERSRHVVVLAQDEARNMKYNHIGTEHILLGLLREEEGLAARALESCEITVDKVRDEIKRICGPGDTESTGQLPMTPRAKKVLELSLREALSLGHNYVGTEHILLGLVREGEGLGYRILEEFGGDAEKIRNEVIRLLSGTARTWNKTAELNEELKEKVKPKLPLHCETSDMLLSTIQAVIRTRDSNNFDQVLALASAYREIVEANKI